MDCCIVVIIGYLPPLIGVYLLVDRLVASSWHPDWRDLPLGLFVVAAILLGALVVAAITRELSLVFPAPFFGLLPLLWYDWALVALGLLPWATPFLLVPLARKWHRARRRL